MKNQDWYRQVEMNDLAWNRDQDLYNEHGVFDYATRAQRLKQEKDPEAQWTVPDTFPADWR